MSRTRWFVVRLVGLFARRSREQDLDRELQFHLDEEINERAAAGLSAADAARAARRSLGNATLVREDARDIWRWRPIEDLLQDLRYAVRVLRRQPAFTITALLSLALGIGAHTAVFSLLKAIQLDRLPVARPGEIVHIAGERSVNSTYSTFEATRNATRTLADVFGSGVSVGLDVKEGSEVHRAVVEFVTGNYFDALGVAARRGRVFHAATSGAPHERAVVISDDYWRTHFAADPAAIGARFRALRHDAEFAIVGIAPPGFRGVHLDWPAEMWISMEAAASSRADLEEDRFRLMGRLRAGSTPAQVEAEAAAILGRPVRITSAARGFSSLRTSLTRPILLLTLVAGLVFLVMSANLANLVLSKTSARDRELSVRRAIGASRGRVVRQLLTESAVLAVAGAILGLGVAYWASAALLSFLPPQQARAIVSLRFEVDWQILGFIVLLSLATCLASGLVPAVRMTRAASPAALRTNMTDGGRQATWLNRSLLVGEVAMCTLLLIVAGVFLRTLQNLVSQDTGYEARGLLVADITGLPFAYSEEGRDQLYEELRARIGALPGVETASFSHVGQLDGGGFDYPLRVPGRAMTPEESRAEEARVTPGFLSAMGTTLVAGRDLSERDRSDSTFVAVVNEAFVRHFGLNGVPIGQRFERTNRSGRTDTIEIVGIVKDAKWATLREASRPIYYVPYRQSAGRPSIRLAVRGTGDLSALARLIVQTARSIDPGLGIPDVVPFTEIVNRSLRIERLVAQVSTAFAALGVLIACVGLYGLLAYSVIRRRREIGIRMAVGATPGSAQWLVMRDALVLLAIGFAIGLPAGVSVARLVSSMLFQLEPGDPITIAATLATLTLATLLAAYLPARRAAGVDPIQVLRED